MNLTRAFGVVDVALLRALTIMTALLIVFRAMPAHADNVGVLIKQLESDSDKVRLAAVLNLTKLGDAKAILPLVKVVGNDSDDAVREAAAVGLGKLATNSKGSIKNLVINGLKKAEANDSSGRVKTQAGKSLVALGAGGGGTSTPPPTGGKNGIYVNIGPMSSKTGDSAVDGKMRPAMVKVSQQTLTRVASSMATTWSGGGAPTSAQLNQKGFQGFYVDGTLNELKVSGDTVSCKISMLLASYPDKSVFGFLNGGAKVQGGSSARDIALASDDCVAAVVEDLIAKKIVPTIKTKAGIP